MKVSQLVSSIQRLQMVKNKSMYKASLNHNNKEIKTKWLELSLEAGKLLEIYNNSDSSNGEQVVELYNKEWLLYLKMKILINNKI